jgi:hypothetical protein
LHVPLFVASLDGRVPARGDHAKSGSTPRTGIPRKNHPHGKQVNEADFYFKPKISSIKYVGATGTWVRSALFLG